MTWIPAFAGKIGGAEAPYPRPFRIALGQTP